MEAAIRWSANSWSGAQRFLIADVAGNSLSICEAQQLNNRSLSYTETAKRDKLPNFTAFDWCPSVESLVAIGTAKGEAQIIQIDGSEAQAEFLQSYPVRAQRKCNSIAWSNRDFLATGLDRARNDASLNIYDTRSGTSNVQSEPFREYSIPEGVTNVKFFNDQPDVLLAGIARQCIRLYDLRGMFDSLPKKAQEILMIMLQIVLASRLHRLLLVMFITCLLILLIRTTSHPLGRWERMW